MKYNVGEQVKVDIADEEYGRVCGTAEVLEVADYGYLVNCHSIRANIIANETEVFKQ